MVYRVAGQVGGLDSWRGVRSTGRRDWNTGFAASRDTEPTSARDHQRNRELDKVNCPSADKLPSPAVSQY